MTGADDTGVDDTGADDTGADDTGAGEIGADDTTWEGPVPHWSTDPFATRTTVHGLASDEVRSALHKHIRHGRQEQAVLTAVELARTDADHEEMLWSRMQIIAADDIGMGEPVAPAVVRAMREGANEAAPGSYDRLVFAAQAAGYLAACPKDTTNAEILQLALLEDAAPTIPPEAICIHTRRGQEQGRTMWDWARDAARIVPEAPSHDRSRTDRLLELYERRATEPDGGSA